MGDSDDITKKRSKWCYRREDEKMMLLETNSKLVLLQKRGESNAGKRSYKED